MRRVLSNKLILGGVLAAVIYLVAATLIPPTPLLEHIRLLQMSTAAAVVVAYAPIAFVTLRRHDKPDRVQQLSLGILLGFLSIMFGGLWSYIWRTSGRPTWMFDSDIQGFIIWLSILAATLHITAPGAINGEVPRQNWITLGIAFGCGVFFAGLTLAYSPQLDGFAEILRPWLQDHGQPSGFIQKPADANPDGN